MSRRASARRILASACSWSWRMRSRDRLYLSPISLRVSSCSVPRPKRWRRMSASIGAQLAEQVADLARQRLPLEVAGRRDLLAVRILEHLAEHAALVVADRLVDRDRLLEQPAPHLLDLVERHVGRRRELLAGRLAAELAGELAARLREAVLRVDHVDRQADLAALVGERAADRVADPPARVGREPEAAAVVVALDRLHQAEVALLDQIGERHAAVVEAARDRLTTRRRFAFTKSLRASVGGAVRGVRRGAATRRPCVACRASAGLRRARRCRASCDRSRRARRR